MGSRSYSGPKGQKIRFPATKSESPEDTYAQDRARAHPPRDHRASGCRSCSFLAAPATDSSCDRQRPARPPRPTSPQKKKQTMCSPALTLGGPLRSSPAGTVPPGRDNERSSAESREAFIDRTVDTEKVQRVTRVVSATRTRAGRSHQRGRCSCATPVRATDYREQPQQV